MNTRRGEAGLQAVQKNWQRYCTSRAEWVRFQRFSVRRSEYEWTKD